MLRLFLAVTIGRKSQNTQTLSNTSREESSFIALLPFGPPQFGSRPIISAQRNMHNTLTSIQCTSQSRLGENRQGPHMGKFRSDKFQHDLTGLISNAQCAGNSQGCPSRGIKELARLSTNHADKKARKQSHCQQIQCFHPQIHSAASWISGWQ